MTVGELYARMSAAEFTEWMALAKIEAEERAKANGDGEPKKGSREYWDKRLRGEL